MERKELVEIIKKVCKNMGIKSVNTGAIGIALTDNINLIYDNKTKEIILEKENKEYILSDDDIQFLYEIHELLNRYID